MAGTMNLFILDTDPYKAASLVCDQHVIKMTSETWQMLSWTVRDLVPDPVPNSFTYFGTHKNHPCTKWVNECQGNYEWACEHLDGLLLEYDRRFPGKPYNFKNQRLFMMHAFGYLQHVPPGARTPFVQCMPEELRGPDPVEAYWNYYKRDKIFARWKLSIPERWL